jgi:outer membrane receptor for ferrienterochelin and colicins
LRFLIALILIPIFVNSAYAQDLSPEKDSLAFSVDLDDYVVTAQYRPTHYKNVIHTIDVIKEEVISKRGVTQLDQALLISPVVRLNYDPILGTQVRLRGISASNVAILIDGIPVIGRLNGAVDLSQIPVQNVERIEIVEGPLSNIYGSNAAGGVINIITKKSQINKFRLSSDHQWESIGIWNNQLTIGGQFGKFLVSGYGRYFTYDQYPTDSLRLFEDVELEDGSTISQPKYPWNPKEQYGFGGQLRYNINNDNSIIFKYDYNHEDVSDYGGIRRPQFNPYANDMFFGTTRNDISLLYQGNIEDYYIDFTAAYNRYDRVTEDKRYYLEIGEFDPDLQIKEENFFNSFFSRLNVAKPIGEKWDVTAGLNFTRETGGGDRIIDPEQPDSTISNFNETAIYSEVKYKLLNNLQFAVSGRLIMHSEYGDKFTPTFQAKYDISPKWSIKAGYAQGYRNPSLKELHLEFIDINHFIIGNPDLEPEISHDLQASVTYTPKSNLDINFNTYRTLIKNRIVLTEFETLKFIYDNVAEYDVFGFQAGVNWAFTNFKVQSNASLGFWSTGIDADDAPSYGGVFDMNHLLMYDWQKYDISFTLNYRLVGKQPIYRLANEEVEVSTVQAIHFIDLSADRSFFENKIIVTAGLRNLLNIRSANVSGQSAGGGVHSTIGSRNVNQGRSVFVKIGFRL